MAEDQDLRFEAIVDRSEAELNLAHAALLIARDEYPDLPIGRYLAQLDEIADEVRRRLGDDADPARVVRAINQYLFAEKSFTGNVQNYTDPRNSYLNDVLERRLGIPITLSVIYLEVGWRLGVRLEGVSFPGHFVVKFPHHGGEVVIDPFFQGISLSESQLLERVSRVVGDPRSTRALLPRLLCGVGKKEILARILRNLKGIFIESERFDRALTVCEKICALSPQAAEELRDRGWLYERLECFRPAVADYTHYLHLMPDATDAPEIRERIEALEPRASRLN